MLDALTVLEFLVLESGNIHFYEEGDAQDIARNLQQTRALLEAIDTPTSSDLRNIQPTK